MMTSQDNPHKPIRHYPVGIQTFSRLRMEGYLYIDKTDDNDIIKYDYPHLSAKKFGGIS
ncbi:MAG: hypothetical protein IKH88_11140 [Prevotella sp.]|nr:hypothetical protein [Prevotella sp.]